MRLDLGGTQEDCDVNISLDGTHIDDYGEYKGKRVIWIDLNPTPRIIGNYFQCPSPDNTFDEATGCCVLEQKNEQYKGFYKEMHRILKHGGKLWVRGCGKMHRNHVEHAAGTGLLISETGQNTIGKDYDEGLTFINIKL